MDVRAPALKAGISANRRGGCQSALKSVDYAPQVLSVVGDDAFPLEAWPVSFEEFNRIREPQHAVS
jgi:hypothetical protein